MRRAFKPSEPVHVIMRAHPEVGSLRTLETFIAIREAMMGVLAYEATFRIVHFSIQRTHIHLIVEAANRCALSTGMQAFGIACAKQINTAVLMRTGKRRRGTVFADRYFARVLKTPREVRNCLAYVLNNWRHHEIDRLQKRPWKIDMFSSAPAFDGWKQLPDRKRFAVPSGHDAPWIWPPSLWLLTTGWRRHGLVSVFERPGGSCDE